eukprot:GHVS01039886.1.p1 GENE.GHVS01039886.1~~GHVS01039886.1.p1  ORF type:complete len:1082 (-),score=147.44 GHVS01039886.1:1976-5221(-)
MAAVSSACPPQAHLAPTLCYRSTTGEAASVCSQQVQTLLIDNYDSYTYSLYQSLTVINGTAPLVLYNDAFNGSWAAVRAAFPNIDNIVISPGPGTPEKKKDFGICSEALREAAVPILGVCLGHQGLASAYGGQIIRAVEPMHGRWSRVKYLEGCALFRDLDSTLDVVRYHSLVVDPFSLPSCLQVICWTDPPSEGRVIMGLQHRSLPLYGIQFHPESIGTPSGPQIIYNFKAITLSFYQNNLSLLPSNTFHACRLPSSPLSTTPCLPPSSPRCSWQVNIVCVSSSDDQAGSSCPPKRVVVDSEALFQALYSDLPQAFWLDSSISDGRTTPHLGSSQSTCQDDRFSYMGAPNSALSEVIEYWGDGRACMLASHKDHDGERVQCVREWKGDDIFVLLKQRMRLVGQNGQAQQSEAGSQNKQVVVENERSHNSKPPVRVRYNIWEANVDNVHTGNGSNDDCIPTTSSVVRDPVLKYSSSNSASAAIPFVGGYVGYLGYEARHDAAAHQAGMVSRGNTNRSTPAAAVSEGIPDNVKETHGSSDATVPVALWMLADRFVAIDHYENKVYAVWIAPDAMCDNGSRAGCDSCLLEQCEKGTLGTDEVMEFCAEQENWVKHVLSKIPLRCRVVGSDIPCCLNQPSDTAGGGERLSPVNWAQAQALLSGQSESTLDSQSTYPTERSLSEMLIDTDHENGDADREDADTEADETENDSQFGSPRSPPPVDALVGGPLLPRPPASTRQGGVLEGKYKEQCGVIDDALCSMAVCRTARSTAARCLTARPDRSRENYEEGIRGALEKIEEGESYEVCLTNHLEIDGCADPLRLYSLLRRRNPVPYACFMIHDCNSKLPGSRRKVRWCTSTRAGVGCVGVCCSSPERFLKMDGKGWLQSKPIKGTRRRGATAGEDMELAEDLQTNVKDRAENLMIVDLVRNDLGRVCQAGSVVVPKLLCVESYATVHQLVSTIRGKLEYRNFDALDAIVSCFPGGSMTGAPKKRTQEILHRLEQGVPRGIYSGGIGFLSMSGSFDINIVIRTIVLTQHKLSVGAGGAIVALSDVKEEYEEMLLKARSVLQACRDCLMEDNKDHML